jgi:hypothetical protein
MVGQRSPARRHRSKVRAAAAIGDGSGGSDNNGGGSDERYDAANAASALPRFYAPEIPSAREFWP